MDISTFKSKLGGGGARPNQFEVVINYPGSIGQKAGQTGRFLITTAELPGQTMGVTPIYYRGRLIKLAGDKEFAPFSCSVINDSEFTVRSALEEWMNLIENRLNKEPDIFDVGHSYCTQDIKDIIKKKLKELSP
jgi:hypothetical protein